MIIRVTEDLLNFSYATAADASKLSSKTKNQIRYIDWFIPNEKEKMALGKPPYLVSLPYTNKTATALSTEISMLQG